MKEVYINIKDFGDLYIRKYLEQEFNKDLISVEELVATIEDLISEVESYKEKYEELEKDLEDNYRPQPMSYYTGDSYDDRFNNGGIL